MTRTTMSDETTDHQDSDDETGPLATPENRRWGLIFLGIVAAVLVYCFVIAPMM